MSNDPEFDEFVRISNEFARAICSNESAQIAACLSPDWVLITPEVGPVPREHFLRVIDDGTLSHQTMAIDVVRVKVYGDTALVTGRGKNTGTFKGEPITADEWTTDIYRRTDGRWRCVLTQLTPVAGA